MLHKITPVHIATSCAVSQTQMNSSINWGVMIMGPMAHLQDSIHVKHCGCGMALKTSLLNWV